MIGYNINSLGGNAKIPDRLVYNKLFSSHDDFSAIKVHTRCARVRTLLWPTERDPVETPWLHVPFNAVEVEQISTYIKNCPLPMEVAIGPLWEADWMVQEGLVDVKPDNPFATAKEVADALLACVESILSALASVSGHLDLYNEFEPTYQPRQKEVMETYYPRALAACRAAGVRCTVSAIVDPNGNCGRATAAMDWLVSHGGLTDFLELHPNGLTNFNGFIDNAINFYYYFASPWKIGECDVDMTLDQLSRLSSLHNRGLEEILLWV